MVHLLVLRRVCWVRIELRHLRVIALSRRTLVPQVLPGALQSLGEFAGT
ncbi:hypothetical protein [Haliangium ochraceum]|nr:hypothetical protein [Haliangium ochraceum]